MGAQAVQHPVTVDPQRPLLAPHGGLYAHIALGDEVCLRLPTDDGSIEVLWAVVEAVDTPGANPLVAVQRSTGRKFALGLRHVVDWRRQGSPSPLQQAVAAAEWWIRRRWPRS